MKGKRGIALLVALGTMIVLLIAGALVIYLIVRGLNLTRGQTQYETTYEAAIAALEMGKAEAARLNANSELPQSLTDSVQLGAGFSGTYSVQRTQRQVITMSGTAIKFARAIAGPGSTPASGSYRTYYITASAVNPVTQERVRLEAIERFTVEQE
uniref:Type 4 fimbrial biogenesis protein PilX N-terminal domain-containing protein n=1 Tax=candidate division WOR-3 bacterium TaxID=2052148 RepID=A0A7C4TCY0_UNCW3